MVRDLCPSWAPVLDPILASAPMADLAHRLDMAEAQGTAIYPPRAERLAAFALTPLDAVRCVILGQDPYHGPGQAMGLAFSVPAGCRVPPSLRNIFRELHDDCGIAPAASGDLRPWARQGVLLLNTALSVEAGRAGSHAGAGWGTVTDAAIAAVAARRDPTVFILWGRHAQAKRALLEGAGGGRHCVIASPHPSPLSARTGFFGSRPFSRANAFLDAQGLGRIDWRLG